MGGSFRVNRLEPSGEVSWLLEMQNPFRYFNSLSEIIQLAVMMYVRYPFSVVLFGAKAIEQAFLNMSQLVKWRCFCRRYERPVHTRCSSMLS